MVDPAQLTADLIRCASVTPVEGGALTLLEDRLSSVGFTCTRVDRGDVSNLFARWGTGKTFGFNGHTDVVPVGDVAAWTVDPFGAEIRRRFYVWPWIYRYEIWCCRFCRCRNGFCV